MRRDLLRLGFVAATLFGAALVGCSSQSAPTVAPVSRDAARATSPQRDAGDLRASATPAPTPSPAPTMATCVAGPNPKTTTLVRNPVALKRYTIDPKKIFVSGISSGGFFGVQMHIAHSAVFKGAAIYAGGVDYCARDNVGLALAQCGGETNVDCQALYQSTLAESESFIDTASSTGTIDDVANLAGQPVYLWSGTKDQVVNPLEMADLDTEYQNLNTRVTFDNSFPANHGWESPDGEVPCPSATEPYMISCAQNGKSYDSPKTWLTRFFGSLAPRNDGALHGSLINFDQTEFGASAANSMDTNGWVFVPQACAQGTKCGFVLALHGCIQNQAVIGTKFIAEAGLDEWADTNKFVVMYPYAVESSTATVYNPMGCWDWWGYDDPDYATKNGTQISAVYQMVQRVTGAP